MDPNFSPSNTYNQESKLFCTRPLKTMVCPPLDSRGQIHIFTFPILAGMGDGGGGGGGGG